MENEQKITLTDNKDKSIADEMLKEYRQKMKENQKAGMVIEQTFR